jgi:formylglycine-generating enzyme required for sulfatase activity
MSKFICRSLFLAALLTSLALTGRAPAQTAPQLVPMPSALPDNDMLMDLRLPRPLSRYEEAALKPLDRFRECEHCPEMVVIPGGRFLMGANAEELGSTPDERPQHEVNLQRFGVGRLPVTLDEWSACLNAKGCSFQSAAAETGRGRQFIGNILWEEAREYVQWLSRKTGRPYRLLSEAEREYVTRAGTTTAFWWGDSLRQLESASDGPRAEISSSRRTTVGFVPPVVNPWGLLEVHGPVYDWVEDCWHENYEGAPTDGSAWETDDCNGHVLRGGAFSRSPQTRRSAARLWSGAPNRFLYMSVRVARTFP